MHSNNAIFYLTLPLVYLRSELCNIKSSQIEHRKRRWKTYMKQQKSEALLYNQLRDLTKTDSRPLVLAYGSWGLVAGKPGAVSNRKNAPCIGVGLMRKLSTQFIVCPTPEQYTSKTCHICLGECGPHPRMRTQKKQSEIRGLRVCQDESCRAHLNRDINASRNIGLQFARLFEGKGPIRAMTSDDMEFHRHNLRLHTDEDDSS